MNSSLFFDWRARPLSISGGILPRAKLKFFLTQTLTPTPVYSDAALGTPLGTSVTADGDGHFPMIYMDGAITYRAQLYDENDVLQPDGDVDPLAPSRDWPSGTVVMFYGNATARDVAYPPALWQVLDGTNGTPDARDKLLMVAGGTYEAGDSGGVVPSSGVTGSAGAHDHGAATGTHAITTAEMPSHIHPLRVCTVGSGSTHNFDNASGIAGDTDTQAYYTKNSGNVGSDLMQGAGSGDAHGHTITGVGDHNHTIDSDLPPFMAFWFLMRRS